MQLTPERLEDYLLLREPNLTELKKSQMLKRLQKSFASGQRFFADTFIMDDPLGNVIACLRLVPLGEKLYILSELITARGISNEQRVSATQLIFEAVERAHRLVARQLFTRINMTVFFNEYGLALARAGFRKLGERVEYRAEIVNLPDDIGTPFTWRNMEEVGLETTVTLFRRVSEEATDYDPDDNPEVLLRTYLSEPDLTTGHDCVHIGYLGSEPVALVIAQVSPEDGWSRITYMGLISSMRNKGLGKWVHRHGFTMMRSQGGLVYHGGCTVQNSAMKQLFIDHHCLEDAHYMEWIWKGSVTRSGSSMEF